MDIPPDYIPLKLALYGPNGLYPDVRYTDVRRFFGRPLRRRSRGGFMVEFVREADVERVRRQINKELENQL